jgi:prepilin-type N-terminal cleavage/methylation domain-containing protein
MKRSRGFTLIELLVSTALASLLTAVCITAFQQGRANIERSEARVRMHANAQGLYMYMQRSVSSLMQDCALVSSTTKSSGPGTGDITLVFMKGKEDENDWLWQAQTTIMNSDLQWEVWRWRAATQNLSIGTSSNQLVFQIQKSYKPNGKDDYNGQQFLNLDAPRRTLSATNPWADLDSDIYFPTPGTTVSAVCPGQDVGDWTDLCQNMKTVLTHVSDFSLQIVRFDGTVDTVDDTTTTLNERDGVWLDGRIATATAAALAPNYQSPLFYPDTSTFFPGSAITLRPRILRVRFTLTDPPTGASQTFSFSFAMPGLAGAP